MSGTLTDRFKRLSLAATAAVFLIGCAVLGGWVFGIAWLKAMLPGTVSMKFNTALCFIFSTCSLYMLGASGRDRRLSYSGYFCALLVVLIASLTLIEYASGLNLSIDQLLIRDSDPALEPYAPGRMAIITALSFLLLGASLISPASRPGIALKQALAFAVLLTSLLAIIGYAYGASSLYRILPHISIALHTAVAFVLLSLAILFARPERGVMRLISSEGLAGIMLRRLLPALILPFVMGWMRLLGQRAGYYDTEFGLSIFVLSNVIVFACLTWFTARFVHQIDAERTEAQNGLRQAHDELEIRVKERTAELEASNKRLTLEIDERKRSEEALRASESRFSKAFNSSPSAMSIMRLSDNRLLDVNESVTLMSGYSREELIGRTPRDLKIWTNKQDRSTAAQMIRETQKVREIEIGLRCKAGDEKRCLFSAEIIDIEGEPCMLSTLDDITERRGMEAEVEQARDAAVSSARSKAEFLANMSHEIRTPMNAVIGMTSLLLNTQLSIDQRDFIETIKTSGAALLAIINDILDFSKIEAGRLDLEDHIFELRGVVEESLDLIATRAGEKGLNLAYLIDANAPHAIVGDPTRLRQILINLLSNAVKFTEIGEVVVTIICEPPHEIADAARSPIPGNQNGHAAGAASDGAPGLYQLHFIVEDTGIGISRDGIKGLFQSFSQIDASTTRRYGGTGLGLVISRRLADMMHGRMWVESEVGRGSKFHFTVQARASESQAESFPDTIQPQLSGRRLLVIDEYAANRVILSQQVEHWGMACTTASSRREALGLISGEDAFDVAIIDAQMHEMGAMELVSAIRGVPGREALPLIMLSPFGQSTDETARGCFSAFLSKPIKPAALFEALVHIFQTKRQEQTAQPIPKPVSTKMADRLPLNILLAEDNVVNQKVATSMLKKLGYQPDVVGNGIEAVNAITRRRFDLVLMDIQMPEMDGLEAAKVIAGKWSISERPLIVAMTAHAMKGDREECLAAGMNDYISKPITIEELALVIERCWTQAGRAVRVEASGR
ncbi:MAG: hypothetical protein DMF61_04920 [Blastocatellia bacterium AA13]|nr:MAG: hypothetical protein DMF61_04920 [Blastocatellia bacterium AA13]